MRMQFSGHASQSREDDGLPQLQSGTRLRNDAGSSGNGSLDSPVGAQRFHYGPGNTNPTQESAASLDVGTSLQVMTVRVMSVMSTPP